MERWGSESFRDKANQEYINEFKLTIEDVIKDVSDGGFKNPDFTKLDLRPSNICNFKCRTCSSDYSTKWIAEEKAYNEKFGVPHTEAVTISKPFGISNKSTKNLKDIYIAGGESLYMEEMYKFLETIPNKNEIKLSVHTNFSILKFKKYDVFKLLEDFQRVVFFISTDGMGELGEYIRTGSNYNKFCKNVEKLLQVEKENPTFSHDFHFTSSILNVFHFWDFVSILKEKKFIKSDQQIHFFPVRWPTWYNSINFNMKDEIVKYYKDGLHNVESDSLKGQIENFINYVENVDMNQSMENRNVDGVDENAIKQFSQIVKFGNQFNKTKLPKELNYLKKYIFEK